MNLQIDREADEADHWLHANGYKYDVNSKNAAVREHSLKSDVMDFSDYVDYYAVKHKISEDDLDWEHPAWPKATSFANKEGRKAALRAFSQHKDASWWIDHR